MDMLNYFKKNSSFNLFLILYSLDMNSFFVKTVSFSLDFPISCVNGELPDANKAF